MERLEQLESEQKEWKDLFQEVLETIDEVSKKYEETGSEEDKALLDSWLNEKEAYIELLKDYSIEISNERTKTKVNQLNSMDSLREEYQKLKEELSDNSLSAEKRIELMESVKKQAEETRESGLEYEKFGSNLVPSEFVEDYEHLIQEIEMQKVFNNSIIDSIQNNDDKTEEDVVQEESADIFIEEDKSDKDIIQEDGIDVLDEEQKEKNSVEEYTDINQYATPSTKKTNVYNINYDEMDYYDEYDEDEEEKGFLGRLFAKFKHTQDDDEYEESYDKDEIEENTKDHKMQDSDETNYEEEETKENSKKGFLSRLFAKFKHTQDDEEYDEYDDVLDIDNVEKPKDKKKLKKKIIALAAGISVALIAGIALIGSNCAGCSSSKNISSDGSVVPSVTVSEVLEHETVSVDGSGKQMEEDYENNDDFSEESEENENSSETIDDEQQNQLDVNLGDKVKMSMGSYIYTNAYDATNSTNGQTPYFSYSTSNDIVGVVLEHNGKIASFVSLEDGTSTYEFRVNGETMYLNEKEASSKINEMKKSGWYQTSVAVSNENASSGVTGFYNVKSIRR